MQIHRASLERGQNEICEISDEQNARKHEVNRGTPCTNAGARGDSAMRILQRGKGKLPCGRIELKPLNLPVRDLNEARNFYGELLARALGHVDTASMVFSFHGRPLTCYLTSQLVNAERKEWNSSTLPHADGAARCGIDLTKVDFDAVLVRLRNRKVKFILNLHLTTFRDAHGVNASLHFLDPTGNALELKSIVNFAGYGGVVRRAWYRSSSHWLALAVIVACLILLQAKAQFEVLSQSAYASLEYRPSCINLICR